MRLALVYLWKEWRAQRGLLLAYTGLIFTCLCLGLSLAPRHFWFETDFGVHALSWFVAAGVIGVVAFVTPSLVRAEFTTKGDQFVRRLPGALAPAFGGKLLFLLLAAALLPLLGLLVGELFVQWREADWNGLYAWTWDGLVHMQLPWVVYVAGGALLLVPWVWAVASGMPGGRLALLGTVLLVLVLGVGAFAIFRQSPGIEKGLVWEPWLWAVPPAGLLVALLAWVRGRRGGGVARSARIGLVASAGVFAVPGVWLGERAWDYHHPDLMALTSFSVFGLSPDARFVLARGHADEDYLPVPLRVDLRRGSAEQLGSVWSYCHEGIEAMTYSQNPRQRYWDWYDGDGTSRAVFDLVAKRWTPIRRQGRVDPDLPKEVLATVFAEERQSLRFTSPDGEPIWFEGHDLCRATADGGVERTQFRRRQGSGVFVVGHGFWARRKDLDQQVRLFDWRGRAFPTDGGWPTSAGAGFVVGDEVVWKDGRQWLQRRAGEELRRCAVLERKQVLGLFDHDHLLVADASPGLTCVRLWLFRPADGQLLGLGEKPIPGDSVSRMLAAGGFGTLLHRDPRGRIWLRCQDPNGPDSVAFLDVASRQIVGHTPLPAARTCRLIDWIDDEAALFQIDTRIVRFDADTGATETLFPREAAR